MSSILSCTLTLFLLSTQLQHPVSYRLPKHTRHVKAFSSQSNSNHHNLTQHPRQNWELHWVTEPTSTKRTNTDEEIPTRESSIIEYAGNLLHHFPLRSFLHGIFPVQKLRLANKERILMDRSHAGDENLTSRRKRASSGQLVYLVFLAPSDEDVNSLTFRADLQLRLESLFSGCYNDHNRAVNLTTAQDTANRTTTGVLPIVNSTLTNQRAIGQTLATATQFETTSDGDQGEQTTTATNNLHSTSALNDNLSDIITAHQTVTPIATQRSADTTTQNLPAGTTAEATTTTLQSATAPTYTEQTTTTMNPTSASEPGPSSRTTSSSARRKRELATESVSVTANINPTSSVIEVTTTASVRIDSNGTLTHHNSLVSNSTTSSALHVENCSDTLSQTIMIVNIFKIDRTVSRKKRQASQRVKVFFAILRDGHLQDGKAIADEIEAMPTASNEFGYQISEANAAPADIQDDAEALSDENLDGCCILAILLGVALGLAILAFIIYVIYDNDNEKKHRKQMKMLEDETKVEMRLQSDKDQLLKENGELRSNIRRLESKLKTSHQKGNNSVSESHTGQLKVPREQSPFRQSYSKPNKLATTLPTEQAPPYFRHSIHEQPSNDLQRLAMAKRSFSLSGDAISTGNQPVAHPVYQK